jgi:membrane peptidoglycan carboxypeptidase
MAIALEFQSSKPRILEAYLHTAYFGHGAFGITDAALRYFRKLPTELTLAEAATLASILPSPETLTPLRDPEGAQARMCKVLEAMVKVGYVTAEEAASASAGGLPASLQHAVNHHLDLPQRAESLAFPIRCQARPLSPAPQQFIYFF